MRRAPLLLAPLVLALLAGLAAGTSVVRLAFDELVAEAAAILEGRVVAVRTADDGHGVIVTQVTLVAETGFRGVPDGGAFVLTLPGGELGDRGTAVAGIPRFTEGEDVLLFATGTSHRGITLPVGLGQGVWRVRRDPISGARTLDRSFGDVAVFDRAGRPIPTPAPESVDHAAFVERLLDELQAQASDAGRGSKRDAETDR